MANFRFGQVAQSLSQGIGLFAGHKAEEERRKAEEEWQMAMANLRESNAVARENRQEAKASERFAATQETSRQQIAATAEHREASLAQGESQFGRRGDAEIVADAKKALRDRMESLYDHYQDQLEASYGEDPGGAALARYNESKDQAISGFVANMAGSMDHKGKVGMPGFKGIDSASKLASKMITYDMSPEMADLQSKSIWASLSGEGPPPADPNAFVPGQGGGTVMLNEGGGYTGSGQRWDESPHNPANAALFGDNANVDVGTPSAPPANTAGAPTPVEIPPQGQFESDFFSTGGGGGAFPWMKPLVEGFANSPVFNQGARDRNAIKVEEFRQRQAQGQ